jgi:hypothetical protein
MMLRMMMMTEKVKNCISLYLLLKVEFLVKRLTADGTTPPTIGCPLTILVLEGKPVKGYGTTYPELTLETGYVLQPNDTIKILSFKFASDGKWDKKSGTSVQLKNLSWVENDTYV